MIIKTETSLGNFEAWSGAVDTLDTLIDKELCDQLEQILENDIFPNGCTDTELNDLLWFENDEIARWLGFNDWKDLENDGEEKEILSPCECDDFDEFCEQYKYCADCPFYNAHYINGISCEDLFEEEKNV